MTSSATEQPPGGLLDSPLEELIRLVLAIAPVVVEDPAVALAKSERRVLPCDGCTSKPDKTSHVKVPNDR